MISHRDDRAAAENLAGEALAFLAADPERLWRFFDLTGLSPATIRQASAEPGFSLAVVDHLMADETLLMAFAAETGTDPAAIGKVRDRLAGPGHEGLREG